MDERQQLREKAKEIWRRYRSGGSPSEAEKSTMRSAYYDSLLPKDPDYSVGQWVEDGFPELP